MAEAVLDTADIKRRMDGALKALAAEFAGLRTGRASAGLLEPITVDAYGASMPITQVGNIGVPEARMLTVQVWDASLVKAVEKAIRDSDLGLNPQTEGQTIRVPLPELNQERRAELSKVAGKYAEQARIAVRNVRRDGMETLKRMEKDGEISEDEHRSMSQVLQKLTDDHVKQIDDAFHTKEQEIMQV
ncbi:MAG: ribosome recycling factor [Alphaproteobacteria bacterium]|nr:ribosome recycling factor [Alphaproteobacteria bacterium]